MGAFLLAASLPWFSQPFSFPAIRTPSSVLLFTVPIARTVDYVTCYMGHTCFYSDECVLSGGLAFSS